MLIVAIGLAVNFGLDRVAVGLGADEVKFVC
jgi:hypothetical protein